MPIPSLSSLTENIVPESNTLPMQGGEPSGYKEDIILQNLYPSFLPPPADSSDNLAKTVTSAQLYSAKRFGVYDATKGENEFAYGQGWAPKMVNGVSKGLLLTGTTFLQSTVGLVNGLAQFGTTGKASSFYDNDLNKWVDEINKKAEDILPNYYTNKEKDARWYSPDKLFTANFLWDGIIKNMGFTAGAAISGGVFAAGLKALPLTAKLFSVGKAAEALAAIERGLMAADKVAETYGQIKGLSDKFLSSYNLLNPGGRAVVAGLATSGEASFEAYNNMNEFRNSLIEEYKQTHEGQEPLGVDLDVINTQAEKVGNSSYLANVALLSATNYIQFPKILGSSYATEKGMINSLARDTKRIVKEGEKFVEKPLFKSKVLTTINNVRPYLFSSSEAFEEGSQFAITKGTQDYYHKKYKGESSDAISSIIEGITETLTTDEGMENVLIGGLSGSIMMAKGRFREAGEKARATAEALGSVTGVRAGLNTRNLSAFTQETLDAVQRGTVLQEEREELLKQGEVRESKDKEMDYIINYLTPRIKFGRYDLVQSDINDYKALASTEEGFAQLQSEGKALQGDTREAYMNRLISLEQTAGNIKSLYQSLYLRYGSAVGEDNKPLFTDDTINKMIYAASKIADYDSRIPKLSTKLASSGINITAVVDGILKGSVEEYNKAVGQITGMDKITADEKQDLGQALLDIKNMSIDRKGFLTEYNDIQQNPKKYQEQKVETPKPTGEKVTVITKDGEENLTIGEEYYLGATEYVDDEGIRRKEFPRLTILGENPDGTIRIQRPSGKIENISKSRLEKYKLGKVKDTEKSENSSYYFRNVIKQPDNEFFWNIGKKNASKEFPDGIIPGRLEYDNKTDKLSFHYLQNGKEKTKEIGLDQFKPKEGFKQGVFYSKNKVTGTVNELSVEDQKNIGDREKTGKTKQDQSNRIGNRLAILTDLYNELYDKQQHINKLIVAKKNELHNINTGLELLTEDLNSPEVLNKKSKKVTFNALGKKYLAAARRLSVTKEQLEKELANLEIQKNDIESTQLYITEMADDIDLGITGKEFLDELQDQIILLDDLAQETEKQMDGIRGLIQNITKAIDLATDAIRDFIQKFQDKFAQGEFISIDQTYLDIVNNPNFFQGTPEKRERVTSQFNEDLLALNTLIAETEDFEITPNQNKLNFLKSQLTSLENDLETMEAKARALDLIYERFEKIAKRHEEERALTNNMQLQKDLLGTNTTEKENNFERGEYEPNKKKSASNLINSTVLSTKDEAEHEHYKRANRFGFKFGLWDDKKKDEYRRQIVTLQTEALLGLKGLVDKVYPESVRSADSPVEKVILTVIVDKYGKLVGEDGNVLTEEQLQNPLEHAIYEVHPDAHLTGKYLKEGERNVWETQTRFRKNEDETVVENAKAQYIAWREFHEAQTSLPEREKVNASFGILEYVTNADGSVNYDARTPVTETGLVTEKNLKGGKNVLVVATDDVAHIGESTFENAAGRVFLSAAEAGVPLQNRKFNEKEANALFEVIEQVCKNTLKSKDNKASKEEKDKATLDNNNTFFPWLKSMIHWGKPIDFVTKLKKAAGYNSVWFDVVEENGKKVTKLFISGIGTAFDFTPSSLQANKSTILTLFQGMYNNVNRPFTTGTVWKNSYQEILGIDKEGNPVKGKKWANYQSYLLSSEGRKPEDVPLTTFIKPIKEGEVNRHGIYFIGTPTEGQFEQPKPVKEGVEFKSAPVAEAKPEVKEQKGFVLVDGTNTISLGEYGDVSFTIDLNNFLEVKKINESNFKLEDLNREVAKKVVDNENVNTPQEVWQIVYNKILKQITPQLVAILKAKQTPIAPVVEEEEVDEDFEERMNNGHSDPELREQVIEENNKFETEDWPKVEQWLKFNFPNIPIYKVRNIIQATNGKKAWGMLHKAAIYLYEGAETGTVYHEVFEAVWKSIASNAEKAAIIKEFKNREGNFTDRVTKEKIQYKNATNEQLKEELAEEFRDFVLYKKLPKKSGKNFIVRLFNDLVNFFKEFFTGEKALGNTQALFEKIGNGYYRNNTAFANDFSVGKIGMSEIENIEGDENSDYRLETIPSEQQHQIIQHMTYQALIRLIQTDEGLFSLANPDNASKEELYNNLFEDVLNTIATEAKIHKQVNNTLAFSKLKTLFKDVKTNRKDLEDKFEEHLLSYGIEFDENDELALTEDKTKEDPYGDARKIDSFRKMNAAVKLLFATLPVVKNGKIVRNSIGGVNVLPMSEVFVTVKSKLYNSRGLDEMIQNLGDLALNNPNYMRLYRRIMREDPAKDHSFKHLDENGLMLVSAFWNAMKSQNPDVLTLFILSSGEAGIADTSLSTAAKQARKEITSKLINKIKQGTGFFSFNKKAGTYSATDKLKNYKFNNNLSSYTDFLKELGIEFNPQDIKKRDVNDFKEAVQWIYKSILLVQDFSSLSPELLDIKSRLLTLGNVQANITASDYDITYFNINGDQVQAFVGTNAASHFYDVMSQITKLEQLKGTDFEYLLTDVNSKGSVILRKMFDEDGNKKEGYENILAPVFLEGIDNETKGRQTESSRLNIKERLVQELSMNSEGVYNTLVPGDASLGYAQRLHDKGSEFITRSEYDNNDHLEVFKQYFLSEVELAREDRILAKGRQNGELRFFGEILGQDVAKKLLQDKTKTPETIYRENKSLIDSAVNKFLKQEAKDSVDMVEGMGILSETQDGVEASGLTFVKSTDTKADVVSKLELISLNYIIANIEFHKLIFSDPYLYADELKRIKNFLSPRQPLIYGSKKISEAFDNVYNKGYEKGDIGYTDMNREEFKSITMGDILSMDELYEKYFEETDGGGKIMMQANRIFRLRAKTWTPANEKQYRYDIAYEKHHKGIPLSPEEQKIFDPKKKGEDNPGVQDTYTTLKPIVAGNKANGRNYNDILLDKFALVVLSYRIQHQLNPNSNAVKLYNKWQKEGIDYGVYASGRKVGAEVVSELYNSKGEFNDAPYVTNSDKNKPQAIINVPFSIMSVQTEVPSKDKNETTQGSQITKLVTMDFLEAGVPLDFMDDGEFEDRYASWIKLSEGDKLTNSDIYREIKHNQSLLEERIEIGLTNLFKKTGIIIENGQYVVSEKDKLYDTLRRELLRMEVNENVIAFLKDFKDNDVVLESTPAYQQLRHILMSIAEKNIVRQKVNGGMKVQIDSGLLEENRVVLKEIKDKEGNTKQVYQSDILKFYRDKDGERVCEIMLARWFKSDKTDEELLAYFNDPNNAEAQKVLRGIAFRIPTQKQNSIDVFKIAKFLPKDFGDNVVVPSALVMKVGSDFDIDKLSIYFKNVFKDFKGNIKAVPFFGYGKDAKEKLKSLYITDIENRITDAEIAQEKNFNLSNFFMDLALGNTSSKVAAKWIPIFKEKFKNELINDKLPVRLIEQIFIEKAEKLNKRLDKLTLKDLEETVIEEKVEHLYDQSIENEYIESLERLISHPKNFANLTGANSAQDLKDLTDEINKKKGRTKTDYMNVGNMLKRRFMNLLRNDFVTGKQAIGIAAVGQTNHAQNQRTLITIDTTREIPVEDKQWIGDGKIRFKEYNSINGIPTLSMIKNKVGEYISNINSMFIDGYVDISKWAWIMELGATPQTASTWLFLVKLGVPVKDVAYFMNQPIIDEYLADLRNSGYSWLFIDSYRDALLKKYASKQALPEVIPSSEHLYKTMGISVKDLNDVQKAEQRLILGEFLKYAKMANHLFLVTQGSNFDTANLNDPWLIFKKKLQLEKARKTVISSVDGLLDNSFVSLLKDVMFDVRDAYASILISDRPSKNGKKGTREVLSDVLTPYIDTNDRDFIKLARKAVADLFDWAVQTDKRLNTQIASILLGSDTEHSAAQQLRQFADKVANTPNHALQNNFVLKSIKEQSSSKKGKSDNLYLVGKMNKVYDQNLLIAGFQELRNYLGTEKGGLYGKLVRLVVLQSGLTNSPISFTHLLPYEDFKQVYGDPLAKLNDMPNLVDFYNLNVFERINWNNTDIIPKRVAKFKQNYNNEWINHDEAHLGKELISAMELNEIPKVINVPTYDGRKDFITYQWEVIPPLTKEEKEAKLTLKQKKADMKRRGDYSYIHKALMQKVKNEDGTPYMTSQTSNKYFEEGGVKLRITSSKTYTNFLYKAVNAWGESFRAKEFYNTNEASVIDNGYEKVSNEVSDITITNLLFGENVVSSPEISKELAQDLQQGADLKTNDFKC